MGDGNTSERFKNCSKTIKMKVFPVGDTEINKMADFQETSTYLRRPKCYGTQAWIRRPKSLLFGYGSSSKGLVPYSSIEKYYICKRLPFHMKNNKR
jgi:hypothetical protein